MLINKTRSFLSLTFLSLTFLSVMFLSVEAFAQQPPAKPAGTPSHQLEQPDKIVTYISSADVDALIARAKKESSDQTPMVTGKLLKLPPYSVNLEYRPSGEAGHFNAATHEKDAELFYVLDGSGTLVTGGTLTADHMGIDGGESRHVSKGDFIFIPEGTPHMFSHVDKTLVLASLHMPRPVPK